MEPDNRLEPWYDDPDAHELPEPYKSIDEQLWDIFDSAWEAIERRAVERETRLVVPTNSSPVRIEAADGVTVLVGGGNHHGGLLVATLQGALVITADGSSGSSSAPVCEDATNGHPHLVSLAAGAHVRASAAENEAVAAAVAVAVADDESGSYRADALPAFPTIPPIAGAGGDGATAVPTTAAVSTEPSASGGGGGVSGADEPAGSTTPAPEQSDRFQLVAGMDSSGLFRVVEVGHGVPRMVCFGDGKLEQPPAHVPPADHKHKHKRSKSKSPRARRKKPPAEGEGAAEPTPRTTPAHTPEPLEPAAGSSFVLERVLGVALSDDQTHMALAVGDAVKVYDLTTTDWFGLGPPPPPHQDVDSSGASTPVEGESEQDEKKKPPKKQPKKSHDDAPTPSPVAPAKPSLVREILQPSRAPTPGLIEDATFDRIRDMALPDPVRKKAIADMAAAEADASKEAEERGEGRALSPADAATAAAVGGAAKSAAMIHFHEFENSTWMSAVWPSTNIWLSTAVIGAAAGLESGGQKQGYTHAPITASCANGKELLAVGMVGGTVTVWDLARNQPRCSFNVGDAAVTAMTFSAASSLVVGGAGGECCIFNCALGTQITVELATLDELPGAGMPAMADAAAVQVTGVSVTENAAVVAQANGRIVVIDQQSGAFLHVCVVPSPWQVAADSVLVQGGSLYLKASLYADANATTVFEFNVQANSPTQLPLPLPLPLGILPRSLEAAASDYAVKLVQRRADRKARMKRAVESCADSGRP